MRKSRWIPACLILLCVARVAASAPADDETDHDRLIHAATISGFGVAYLVLEFSPLIDSWSPKECRWCAPDGFDRSVRDALHWNDTGLANTLSTMSGYVSPPLAMTGLLIATSWNNSGDWRTQFDDIAPVIETPIVTSLLQHGIKLIVARQRPYAWAAPPGTVSTTNEDNVSFWSGHTSLDFALAVSAGSVASRRGYRLAPAIWITGFSLATVTGYLRIAADRHWTTDVLTGAAVGSAMGYFWPRLMYGHLFRDAVVVPTSNGIALGGSF